MKEELNSKAIKAGRVSSGLTQVQAAEIIGVSQPTYAAREQLPKAFTIDELEDLFEAFDVDGKRLIQKFIDNIFLITSVKL